MMSLLLPSRFRRLFFLGSKQVLPWLLASVPLLFMIYQVARYPVDVPFFDDWSFVPLVEKWYLGNPALGDLWHQHNEHRMFFAKVIIVGLAAMTSWNMTYEVALNALLGAGIFLVFVRQAFRIQTLVGECGLPWLIPGSSLIAFSMGQWESWVAATSLAYYLSVFCSVAGIVLLSKFQFSWHMFLSAALLGVIASYSFGSGLMYWPIGILLLYYTRFERQGVKGRIICLWGVASLLVMCGYFYGYRKPPRHPSLLYGLEDPKGIIHYLVAYLGGPLFFQNPYATYAGIAGVLSIGAMTVYLYLNRNVKREWFLGAMALGLFSFGSAIVTAAVRGGFGSWQALAPRYVTVSTPFWLAFVLLLAVTVKALRIQWRDRRVALYFVRVTGAAVYVLLLYFVLRNSVDSVPFLRERGERVAQAGRELFVLKDDTMLRNIHPSPELVKQRTRILRDWKLSVFRQH